MKGYSLIEIMVVIVVLALMLVFAIPSLQQLRVSMKAETQLHNLIRVINYSRVLAITKNQQVELCPRSQSDESCGVNWQQGINVYLLGKKQPILQQVVDDFGGADLRWNRNSPKIIFAADGALKSQNGSFTYQSTIIKDYKKHVILSSTGRARIE